MKKMPKIHSSFSKGINANVSCMTSRRRGQQAGGGGGPTSESRG